MHLRRKTQGKGNGRMSRFAFRRRAGRLVHVLRAHDAAELPSEHLFAPLEEERGSEVSRIEDLRKELLSSTATISDFHFGSGEAVASRVTRVAHECRYSSVPARWCRVLFRLVRKRRPATCIELGTNLGISSAYLAVGLKLNGAGRLFTIEGSPSLTECAKRNLTLLGLDDVQIVNSSFETGLPDTLKEAGSVDFAFVDGHHDERATLDYAGMIIEASSEGAILVFDDIRWSSGMARAWERIAADKSVTAVYDCYDIGAVVVREPGATRKEFTRIRA